MTAGREELHRLRRENRQLRLEREILPKSATWFARETNAIPPKDSGSLRRNSREIVEAVRPSRRATSRTEQPCTQRSAISSRSANERYRPDSGFADGSHGESGGSSGSAEFPEQA
jgi:hypothetical protein